VILRIVHVHRIWGYLSPLVVVLALGALYEIIESWAARLAAPSVGIAYLGAQGDTWDGQKDMSLAFLGAAIAMFISAAHHKRTGHEPYLH
jgi:putative membrane protein